MANKKPNEFAESPVQTVTPQDGYPRELADKTFVTIEDFNRFKLEEFNKLQLDIQKMHEEFTNGNLENENATLKSRLANVHDLGKWAITTLIALAALGINWWNATH